MEETETVEIQEWPVAKPKKWKKLGLKTCEWNPGWFMVGVAGLPTQLLKAQIDGMVRKGNYILTCLDRFSGRTVSLYWQFGHPVCDMRVEVHPTGYLPFGE